MSDSLGTFIRERRQELGLTQEQLAERIGDTFRQAEVSRLEHDRITLPRRDRLAAVAAALEVTLGELLIRSGWMQVGDDFPEAIPEPPGAERDATDPERLVAAADPVDFEAELAAALAMLARTTDALEQAQDALASLQRLIQNTSSPRAEVSPPVGIIKRWETSAVHLAT
jgi:transcriptional regulator with XRE-family HTH domain